jgi:hypothetical protein
VILARKVHDYLVRHPEVTKLTLRVQDYHQLACELLEDAINRYDMPVMASGRILVGSVGGPDRVITYRTGERA